MRRCLAALLCALLALAAPAAALGGDQQDTDPFAEEPQTQTQPGGGGLSTTPQGDNPSGSGSSGSGSPGSSGSGSGASGGAGGSGSAGTAPARSGQLPNTGAEAWFVALLGLGLVVGGVGLRLRTADERF